MRRTTNGYFGPEYDNRPTFRVQARWLLIRYIQSFGCLICLPFFVITANSRVSYARNAPKFITIDGGWGYILAITCISLYIFLSVASFFFICYNVVLSPVEGFGADVFILALWIASLAGTIVARINYSKAISAAQSRQISTPSSPGVGLWMLFICLAVCIEQIIAERVEAVRAPPTYWYATSNRPRVDVGTTSVHDPEAGDETLPLYRP
ncbi:hypothetical protein TWF225_008938 [Orbilia oligospora]|nr:hypothetical protein TWF225_008938 [Orbilia oligospora]KAF3264767.1 hypothetical protein TWF217_002951 [Orbilia oligospora]